MIPLLLHLHLEEFKGREPNQPTIPVALMQVRSPLWHCLMLGKPGQRQVYGHLRCLKLGVMFYSSPINEVNGAEGVGCQYSYLGVE